MRYFRFTRPKGNVNPPEGVADALRWLWALSHTVHTAQLSGASLLLLVVILSSLPESAFAASGGQPFVLHETFQSHAAVAAPHHASGHGVVGLDLLIQRGHYPIVQGVFKGTPAAKQGFLPGDIILAIDGTTTLGKNVAEVDVMISDVPGERVTFMVQRGPRLSQMGLTVTALDDLPSSLRSDFSSLFGSEP